MSAPSSHPFIKDLILAGELPERPRFHRLTLDPKKNLSALPEGLTLHTLEARESHLRTLPEDLRIGFKLDLSGSIDLESLPANLSVPVLILRNCTGLTALPEGLQVDFLDISGCAALRHWPDSAQVRIGTVNCRGCLGLRALPSRLGPVTSLDLAGCVQLTSVPEGVEVQSWIDVGGTGITSLPASLAKIPLRWRGVDVTPRIAFFPETIDPSTILSEPNAEVRRVMIERVGFERFLSAAHAETIHRDTDPGGPRELLRVRMEGDEDLVCVSVRCPSTGRHYLIRVPPNMKTCRQAVAWTAGFDNAEDYAPEEET